MTADGFVSELPGTRVVFGIAARRDLADEIEALGVSRPFVVASPRLADETVAALRGRLAGDERSAAQHVPADLAASVTKRAIEAGADGLVAVGGGSVIGLAKAVALETGWPILAVPTTYAGSEMTSIWGLTRDGKKETGRDARVRPKTVIYDPELFATLPPATTATSGLNALAHAVEALYASRVDPMTLALAEESVRAIVANLETAVCEGAGDARRDLLYGAWLAGFCLDRATMGVHHKLCHVLGGTFQLPHAEVHSVILPHAVAFNQDAAPEAMRRLTRALGSDDPARALFDLARRVGAPLSLARIGMSAADLDRAATIATERAYPNPRLVERRAILALLERAMTEAGPGRIA